MWLMLFWIFVAVLPFSFALNPTASIDLQLTRIFVLVLFLAWLSGGLAGKKLLLDRRVRFFLLAVFLLICFLSFFWSLDQGRALRKIIFIFNFAPLYLIAFTASKNEKQRIVLLKILAWSSACLSVVALALFFAQFVFGLDPVLDFISASLSPFFLGKTFSQVVLSYPSWLVNIGGKNFLRAFGTFPDPHLFSLYLNMLLPLMVFLCFKTKEKKYYLLTGLLLFSSLLAFSRASYISLLGCFLFVLFTSNIKAFLQKKPLFWGLFALLFCSLLIIPNPLIERLSSSFNPREGSNSGRIEMWKKAVQATKEFPYLGVGIGNFSRYVDPSSDYREPAYAHNLFLDFSSETGLPNAIFLALLLSSPVFAFFKKPTPWNKALSASLIIFLGHSLFETPFFSVHVFPLVLIILGLKTDE